MNIRWGRSVVAALVVVATLAMAAPAGAQAEAATFVVAGDVEQPLELTVDELRALAQEEVTATFTSGTGVETHTWRGVPLDDLLQEARPTLLAAFRNAQLRLTVTLTASDGYQVALAYGEIDPGFGAKPALLATEQDGVPLDDEGPRLVMPGDDRGGRYLFGVTSIVVGTAWPEDPAWVPAGQFAVYGEVDEPALLDTAALAALPSETVAVSYRSGTGSESRTFRGVPLLDLLDEVGVAPPPVRNGGLAVVVSATGSDSYQAVVSIGEADPAFGGVGVLVAFEQDGQRLALPRLVVPGDVRGGRYVSDVTNLAVALTHTALGAPAGAEPLGASAA